MSSPPTTRVSAPRRYTSAVLTVGVTASAVFFVIALLGDVAAIAYDAGSVTDVGAVISGLSALSPWAWATLGVYAIVATPAAGLLATVAEYASVSERRTALVALAVLAILTVSAAVASGLLSV